RDRRGLCAATGGGRTLHQAVRHGHACVAPLRQPVPPVHRAAQSESRHPHCGRAVRSSRRGHRDRGHLGRAVPPCPCGAYRAGRGCATCRSPDFLACVTDESLTGLLATELQRPAPGGALALAESLARRGGAATVAVLYYGSALRAESLEGILDFYVLVDDVGAWPGSLLARLGNRLLPPNVGYLELPAAGAMLGAKYAVMSPAQFAARTGERTQDTTIWARFSQPALCIWARSITDRAAVSALVAGAVVRAAWWAAHIGPVAAPAADYWRALFARTYAAELRVETAGRVHDIVGRDAARYTQLLPLAWHAAGIGHARREDGTFEPMITAAERRRATRQ